VQNLRTKVFITHLEHINSFTLQAEITNEMEPLFSTYCKIDDPYNTGLMTLEKWKTYKRDMANIEELGVPLEAEVPQEQDYYESDNEKESSDIDFYKFAQSERDKLLFFFDH
jgi:hypothetical protein